MKKLLPVLTCCLIVFYPLLSEADLDSDLKAFKGYFKAKFPSVEEPDYQNGVYAIDSASREQWVEMEEFPPYELHVDNGEIVFHKKFKNGKSLATCFPDYKEGVKHKYPYFSETDKRGVITLELAINDCLKANGERPFKYKKGKMGDVSAYLSYLSRGKVTQVKLDSDGAKAAYERGKQFFYAKRGQLNLSCADCHVYNSGNRVRADLLSPALGHTSHFPVYRSKWGNLGTMHRRYGGCNKQVRAKPFKAQSKQYRELELFHTAMSNGQVINAPGQRK